MKRVRGRFAKVLIMAAAAAEAEEPSFERLCKELSTSLSRFVFTQTFVALVSPLLTLYLSM